MISLFLSLCACALSDDTHTSPIFSHFLHLSGKTTQQPAKAMSGVDMTGYKQMMKNFDK